MPTATGQTFTLGSVVEEVLNKNIRLFPILNKQFKHIQHAFFDVKDLNGSGALTLKPKEIPGIEHTLTVDGYSVKWYDYSMFDFNTTVKTTAASLAVTSGEITVSVEDTSGFAKNDSVIFVKTKTGNSNQIQGVVKSFSGNNLVVKVVKVDGSETLPGTVAVLKGQAVERGYFRRNDNEEIARPSYSYDYKEFKSYTQHFSRSVEFTKEQLNKVYKFEGDAKTLAMREFAFAVSIIFQEVNKAIYLGANKGPGAGELDKMEMLGLETVVHECGSFKEISSPANAWDELNEELSIAFRSGATSSGENIMLLCNDIFLHELSKIERSKVRHDSKVTELGLEIMTLKTIYGSVDIIRDPMLGRIYSTGVAFIVPRSLVKLWVRENQSFEPKKGITRADQSIRVYKRNHNIYEKEVYDLVFELGMIVGGMSEGANCPIRMIKNFRTPPLVS